MARFRQPSAAVLAARSRRLSRAQQDNVRIEWFVDQVANKVELSMKKRVKLATEFVRTRVVQNISRPVTKGTGPRGGRVVTDRSKPGEFPKADTTQLMKSIFGETKKAGNGIWDGFIGTPIGYGLILETEMDRAFLARTLNEERRRVRKILTGPRPTIK